MAGRHARSSSRSAGIRRILRKRRRCCASLVSLSSPIRTKKEHAGEDVRFLQHAYLRSVLLFSDRSCGRFHLPATARRYLHARFPYYPEGDSQAAACSADSACWQARPASLSPWQPDSSLDETCCVIHLNRVVATWNFQIRKQTALPCLYYLSAQMIHRYAKIDGA